jgi:hypothetical protein
VGDDAGLELALGAKCQAISVNADSLGDADRLVRAARSSGEGDTLVVAVVPAMQKECMEVEEVC